MKILQWQVIQWQLQYVCEHSILHVGYILKDILTLQVKLYDDWDSDLHQISFSKTSWVLALACGYGDFININEAWYVKQK